MVHGTSGSTSTRSIWKLVSLLAILALVWIAVWYKTPSRSSPTAPGSAEQPDLLDEAHRPRAVFIGDSYTAGSRGDGARWTKYVANRNGWIEVNLARGGTGYATDLAGAQAKQACGMNKCSNFVDMADEAIANHPDVVIVSGGRNDIPKDITNGSRRLFTRLRTDLPKARIMAISPLWDSTPYPDSLRQQDAILRSNAAAAGIEYVEVGSPLAGCNECIADDLLHPNSKGYAVLGSAIASKIQPTH